MPDASMDSGASEDAGAPPDSGPLPDAGPPDSGPRDSGAPDGGPCPRGCDDGVECTIDECVPERGTCQHRRPDVDMDGAGDSACGGSDCNDMDPEIRPGRFEICNGRDDNCTAGGGPEPAEDMDMDGFADDEAPCFGGTIPRTDCDDTDPMISPGAPEACNGADDNCNRTIDEDPTASESCLGTGLIPRCIEGACYAGRAVRANACNGFSCALMDDATVWCWGQNDRGQLGRGMMTPAALSPGPVSGLRDVRALGCAPSGACAVHLDGTVSCWGNGTTRPMTKPGLVNVAAISSGDQHTCAVSMDGSARCWGRNADGELGDGSTTTTETPVTVMGLADAVEIAVGWYHSCARRATGAVVCWGRNTDGQLGNGTTTSSRMPVPVTGIADATRIALGSQHGCAQRASGAILCWGLNAAGQLGDGTTMNRTAPVSASGFSGTLARAFADTTSCAIRSGGQVACWGYNSFGTVGDGTPPPRPNRLAPFDLPMFSATDVAGGYASYCAATAMGIHCWGYNRWGNVTGDPTTGGERSTPTRVAGLP